MPKLRAIALTLFLLGMICICFIILLYSKEEQVEQSPATVAVGIEDASESLEAWQQHHIAPNDDSLSLGSQRAVAPANDLQTRISIEDFRSTTPNVGYTVVFRDKSSHAPGIKILVDGSREASSSGISAIMAIDAVFQNDCNLMFALNGDYHTDDGDRVIRVSIPSDQSRLVRVVDAENGESLAGISVSRVPPESRFALAERDKLVLAIQSSLGTVERLVEGQNSPVPIGVELAGEDLWFYVPWYRLKKLVLARKTAPSITLPLDRIGAIHVNLPARPSTGNTTCGVCVKDATGKRQEILLESARRSVRFAELSPGEYAVELRAHPRIGVPSTIEKATVSVRHRNESVVEFDKIRDTATALVEMDFTVVLPNGATKDSSGFLEIRPEEGAERFDNGWERGRHALSSFERNGQPNIFKKIIGIPQGRQCEAWLEPSLAGPVTFYSVEAHSPVIIECSDLAVLEAILKRSDSAPDTGDVWIKQEGGSVLRRLIQDEGGTARVIVRPGRYRVWGIDKAGLGLADTTVELASGERQRVVLRPVPPGPVRLRITLDGPGGCPPLDSEFWEQLRIVLPEGDPAPLLRKDFGGTRMSVQAANGDMTTDWSRSEFLLAAPGRYFIHGPSLKKDTEVVLGQEPTVVVTLWIEP